MIFTLYVYAAKCIFIDLRMINLLLYLYAIFVYL
nr:MAG TPA: hypothetical protein [Caudoviricetes sp.]